MDDSNIYLIGFMGCGKSTVASELSEKLGFALLETDDEIVRREGMPITEIFRTKGEPYFRGVETRVVEDASNLRRTVVSCGGGAALKGENVEAMKRSGVVALLTAKPGTVFARVSGGSGRPVLNGNMNVEFISEKMAERRPAYEQAADFSVATDERDVAAICGEIIEKRRAAWERR